MQTLYLECNMGASGKMLMASLYELLDDKKAFLHTINSLISGVTAMPHLTATCGISGTQFSLSIDLNTQCVFEIDSHPSLPLEVRSHVKAILDLISSAVSAAYEKPFTAVFDPVSTVLEITSVCLALYLLQPEQIVVSPIHLGSGLIHSSHGMLPVPTPVVSTLLTHIPCYTGSIEGQLCTPIAAALLAHYGQTFGSMPVMMIETVGCGIGHGDHPAANCVRAFWGNTNEPHASSIIELCCHIDDMTAEALAFASEQLITLGALDVSSAPLTMKKGRSGIMFTVICRPEDELRIAKVILRETTTNGIRSRCCGKYLLTPSIRTAETSYGPIRIKCADGYGIHREKPEYEDVANAARKENLPFKKVWEDILVQTKII